MSKARLLAAALAVPATAAGGFAQLPPAQSVPFNGGPVPPAAPVPPVGSPVGIGSYPAPPGGPTLWSFLGMSRGQREYRQRALADTPFGELRSKIREPLSKATGGLLPPIPPEFPSLAELQAPGPVGAAAKVKLDRLAAKKRIQAVQYLATVDCHYWPEAEDALVDALRADRNEWVRLAAAQTLLKGCCCTKKTILALTMAATCSNADGNPTEKSPRVVAAAQAALNKCLEALCCQPALVAEVAPAPADDPAKPPVPPKKEVPKGEGETAYRAKPGPAGAEKGGDGLEADDLAEPSTREIYARAAGRPWGEMIAFSKAMLTRAPSIPANVVQEALTELTDEPDDARPVTPAAAATAQRRPANLFDALFGDTASVTPAPRPQPQAAAPVQVATAVPVPVARPQPAPLPVVAPPAVVRVSVPPPQTPPPMRNSVPPKPAEPARLAVAVPTRPTPPPPQPVRPVAAVSPVPKAASPTRADRATAALDTGDAKAVLLAVESLDGADVSPAGPLATALLKLAESPVADPAVRTACLRALGRCGVRTPAVLAGLGRLIGDRNVDVRVEAAVALNGKRL
jgi:hypothetical protein